MGGGLFSMSRWVRTAGQGEGSARWAVSHAEFELFLGIICESALSPISFSIRDHQPPPLRPQIFRSHTSVYNEQLWCLQQRTTVRPARRTSDRAWDQQGQHTVAEVFLVLWWARWDCRRDANGAAPGREASSPRRSTPLAQRWLREPRACNA